MFILIGDGEEKSTIEKEISENNIENVKLLGYRKNVNEYLKVSDLFLSTSLWEGLPYSLIECTRAGIPIVASDVIGNNEVVIHDYNGYLFQSGDLETAIKRILDIRSSIERQRRFSENSKKLFNDKFELKTMIRKLADVYSKIY